MVMIGPHAVVISVTPRAISFSQVGLYDAAVTNSVW